MISVPECPYCKCGSRLADSEEVYGIGTRYGPSYVCTNDRCDARVGCHRGTIEPLGTMANWRLRRARNAAHSLFDPLWKDRRMTRTEAYAWLAGKLRIRAEDCHIGKFDLETCERVCRIMHDYRIQPGRAKEAHQ